MSNDESGDKKLHIPSQEHPATAVISDEVQRQYFEDTEKLRRELLRAALSMWIAATQPGKQPVHFYGDEPAEE